MTYECFKYTGHIEAKKSISGLMWTQEITTNLTKHKTLHAYTSVKMIIEKYG